MNLFVEAFSWMLNPTNWGGGAGIFVRLLEHLWYTFLGVAAAAVIAIPIGLAVGHLRRGRTAVVAVSGAARALPTLGVITLIGVAIGIGLTAPLISFVLLAIPSVLAGTYSGIEAVNREVVDASRAMGMTEWQILNRVEIPLALPLIIGGLRAATLQVVATATLAAYVGAGGLGRFLFLGLKTQEYGVMLGASLVVIGIAIVCELGFELASRKSDISRRHPIAAPSS